MRSAGVGLGVAQTGHFAEPDHLVALAAGAEARGYASLWALDRLLAPIAPRSPYPGCRAGLLPASMAGALDPIVALAGAAAVTSTIRLGTSVLVAPWYRPALLARSLASLDVLSRGRLDIGLGLGWSVDEYEAVGVPMAGRAAALEDLLDALDALWRPGEAVHHEGSGYRVAPSSGRPRPVQRPRPPVLLAASTPAGLDRVGRRADGWTPMGADAATISAGWRRVRAAAVRCGRDPEALALVVRANVHHSLVPLGRDRPAYHGSVDQIAGDVHGAFAAGAHHVVLDLQSSTRDVGEYLDLADAVLADVTVPGRPPRRPALPAPGAPAAGAGW